MSAPASAGSPRRAKADSEDDLQLSLKEPPEGSADCDCELQKIHYQAEVDAFVQRLKDDASARAADEEAARANTQKFHDAMIDVASGGVDRARQGAEAIRTAAAAVGVLYTGVLGLAFSADDPLPLRGLVSAVFLALAIVFATSYVARQPKTVEESTAEWPQDTGILSADFEARTSTFITWVREASIQGRNLLRAAILALGFGIAFLPTAFISLGGKPIAVEPGPVYPSPPSVGPSEPASQVELTKILYQAQISEVAELRQTQQQRQVAESSIGSVAIFIAAGIGLVVTLIIGLRATGVSADADESGGDDEGFPLPEPDLR
jgi:hypothetical protein